MSKTRCLPISGQLGPSSAAAHNSPSLIGSSPHFRGGGGDAAGNVHRSRHALNADTIREMHAAFRRGGRKAIEKVMRNQPAVFLKLLVLLVPREHKVEHSNAIKARGCWLSARQRGKLR